MQLLRSLGTHVQTLLLSSISAIGKRSPVFAIGLLKFERLPAITALTGLLSAAGNNIRDDV